MEVISGSLGQGIGLGFGGDEGGEAVAGHDLSEPERLLFADGHVDNRIMSVCGGGKWFIAPAQAVVAHGGKDALLLLPGQAFEHHSVGGFVA